MSTRGGGQESSNAGLTSNVSPEVQKPPLAEDSQTGVSVRYVEHPSKKWYVLRASYGRAGKAYKMVCSNNEDAFLPMRYVLKRILGKNKRVLEPLLPNILFVYATEEYVKSLVKDKVTGSFLSFYLDHFRIDEYGKNPPLTVNYDAMMNFISVTSIDNEHIKVVKAEACHYKSGDKVKITDGQFKGVTGRVARVSGQQRVVVEVEGLCLVATAYIPSGFIQHLT